MMATSIPIIRLRDVLLVAIQVELSDRLVQEVRRDLASAIERTEVSFVVIEVSGVDTFDSYIARSIRDMSHMAKLMGVTTVVAGLDPGVAITLVEMGMELTGVPTVLDLESALDLVERSRPRHAVSDDDLLGFSPSNSDDDLLGSSTG
jgi:rsbT antagonist protein RsbS